MEELILLKRGKKLSSSGILVFEDISTSICQNLVDLKCNYCVSKAEIDSQSVDLGKVGHSNSWKDVKFSFTLKNTSDIPFCYTLEMPVSVSLFDKGPSRVSKIEPRSIQTIGAVLSTKLLGSKTPGPHSLNLVVKNSYNPFNTLNLAIGYQLSILELKVERLVDGQLILPPLDHPLLLESTGSDTWYCLI
jgi:hypothetical protein